MVTKGKFVFIQAIISYKGSGGIAQFVLSAVNGQLHTLATLPLGKQLLVPNELEVGWAVELLLRRKIFVNVSKNKDPDVGLRKLQYATRFH